MDGTVIAGHRLRSTIHSVFDVPCTHDYYRKYETEFWNRIQTKASIVKTLPAPQLSNVQ